MFNYLKNKTFIRLQKLILNVEISCYLDINITQIIRKTTKKKCSYKTKINLDFFFYILTEYQRLLYK